MTRYLISFPSSAMDHIAAEESPAVGKAAHEVVQEAMDAGVWVFGGGLAEDVDPVMVAGDGTIMRLNAALERSVSVTGSDAPSLARSPPAAHRCRRRRVSRYGVGAVAAAKPPAAPPDFRLNVKIFDPETCSRTVEGAPRPL
jgi:hypothetical protein